MAALVTALSAMAALVTALSAMAALVTALSAMAALVTVPSARPSGAHCPLPRYCSVVLVPCAPDASVVPVV